MLKHGIVDRYIVLYISYEFWSANNNDASLLLSGFQDYPQPILLFVAEQGLSQWEKTRALIQYKNVVLSV